MTDIDIEAIIAAARRHGEDSEPDHEVGDLQQALGAMIANMAPKELMAFQKRQSVKTAIGAHDFDADFASQLQDAAKFAQHLESAVSEKARIVGSASIEVQALQWLLMEGWESMSFETRRDLVADDIVAENHAEWTTGDGAPVPGV